jgi:endo-1,4-beta-D-glucanase Y
MCPGAPHPFGSHLYPYPGDLLFPSGGQAALDTTTQQAYDAWKSAYVKQGCGGYYVFSNGGTGTDVGDEVSEGHGYGMVITAMMAGYDPDARAVFDGMYTFFKKFPTATHQNLMSWTVYVAGGCVIPPMQNDSATDGDLDVAYALLLAEQQWPNNGYLAKALAVLSDVLNGDVNANTHLTTLGDYSDSTDPMFNDTRPSDFMLDHWRAFGRATGDMTHWVNGGTVDATYNLISTMQTKFSPTTGLLPDFIVNTNTSPAPAPALYDGEGAGTGQYAWNSCRTPWRITTDYVVSGDSRAKDAISKMNAWIIAKTGGDPSQILTGYALDGSTGATGTGASQAFSSPFGVAAMLSGNQAWLDAIWSSLALNQGYYPDSITLYSMLVMSGNWWPPCQ